MKKLTLCFSLIALSFLSSNSDDNSGKTKNTNIVNTWIARSIIEINADNTFSLQLFEESDIETYVRE